MDTTNQRVRVQIFATDIDGRAVERARAGVYPASIAADVSEARLARFFIQEPGGGTYRMCKPIRDMLSCRSRTSCSTRHSRRLDLISCRNVLIYMGVATAEDAHTPLPLRAEPGGFLFLGTSETVGEFGICSRRWTARRSVTGPRRAQGHATTVVRCARRRTETQRPVPGDGVGAAHRPRGRPSLRELDGADAAAVPRAQWCARDRERRHRGSARPHRGLPRTCAGRVGDERPEDGPRRTAPRICPRPCTPPSRRTRRPRMPACASRPTATTPSSI